MLELVLLFAVRKTKRHATTIRSTLQNVLLFLMAAVHAPRAKRNAMLCQNGITLVGASKNAALSIKKHVLTTTLELRHVPILLLVAAHVPKARKSVVLILIWGGQDTVPSQSFVALMMRSCAMEINLGRMTPLVAPPLLMVAAIVLTEK